MKRRTVLLAGTASAALTAARAFSQQLQGEYRVGVLLPMPGEVGERYLSAVRERLASHGFVDGRNLHIDARFVPYGSRPNLDAARELLTLKPQAIFVGSTLVAQAAQAATTSVPIIFTWVSDPVVSRLVSGYAKPGANITGVSIRFFELAAKRVELARELLPSAKRVAIASGVFDSVLEAAMTFAHRAAERLGLELVRIAVGTDWAKGMQAIVKAGCDAAVVVEPFGVLGMRARAEEVARHAVAQRVPAIFSETESVEVGALMSYATNLADDLRRGADLLARVLRGDKPSELPVDQASRFELALNLKTARSLGLTIPQSLLVRADRVIE